jgi:hypothetical protein
VLGQSHSFLESIGKYCVDKTKIRYFPSWAEEIFVDKSVTPAAEVPRQLNVFTIVFAGNIGEAKKIGKVSVPSQCWKVIHILHTKEYKAYLFNNDLSKPDGIESFSEYFSLPNKITDSIKP